MAEISVEALGIGGVLLGACSTAVVALWRALATSRTSETAMLRMQVDSQKASLEDLVERIRKLEGERLKDVRGHADELWAMMTEMMVTLRDLAGAIQTRPCLQNTNNTICTPQAVPDITKKSDRLPSA